MTRTSNPVSTRGARLPRAAGVLWVLAVSALAAARPATAAKTDILVLRNGDRITGEVKSLSRGKLSYSTDDAGKLAVEWEKVARLTSRTRFDAEDVSGRRYFGSLTPSERDGFVVFTNGANDTLPILRVIGMAPINATFVQRLSAYLDMGFTLAKANAAETFSLSGMVAYRGPSVGTQFSYDSYAQGQENVPTTTRNTIRESVSWFLQHRWSAVALVQFEQNDELNLDHRVTLGGVVERVLSRSNRMDLSVGAGLVGTDERYRAGATTSDNTSLEGLLAADWQVFHFDSPKLDFSTNVALFPSFTQSGRWRGQSNFRLVYELFKDFNTGIRFTDAFDSSPPEGATKNDYTVELTVGWSYRR